MKKILLLTTGGTIASSETKDGLIPAVSANKLLSYIPDIINEKLCLVFNSAIMNIDSTNMNPTLMEQIANKVAKEQDNYDGFVITHGTDTMGYTAAALTYMLQNIKKPVVITGSQIAMEAQHTDAKKNLSDAIRFACEDISGIFVAFNGSIISGVHAVKCKTKSIDAFQSINFPVIASIQSKNITYHAVAMKKYTTRSDTLNAKPFSPSIKLCKDIFLLKMFPGINPDIFDYLKQNYKGIIIESFGIGGIPTESPNITEKIKELTNAGIAVVITTQCLMEGIDLDIYAVGKELAKQSVIYSGDMTTEALTMKLMWALAHCNNLPEIKAFIETPFCMDKSY